MRVLVVEDDQALLSVLVRGLREQGYVLDTAARGDDALHLMRLYDYAAAIVDWRLPGMPGDQLIREVRNLGIPTSILMLTARDTTADKVEGLDAGADDYITKPFSLRELLARIRAVLRRQEAGRAAPQRNAERGRCKFGGWQLDRRTRRLADPSGTEVTLTKGEYALLTAFLDAPQRPLSREHLLQATRVHEDVFDRSIDVQILRLRRKLETDPSAPRIIQTERGVGYVFALPVERL